MTQAELMRCLPRYYASSGVMTSIMGSCADEIGVVEDLIGEVGQQFYASSADSCIDRWENELGIAPNAALSVAARRERVILKLRGLGTITASVMERFCERFLGCAVKIVEDNANSRFWVDVDAGLSDAQKTALIAALDEIKPAHLGVGIRETLSPGIYIAASTRVSERIETEV